MTTRRAAIVAPMRTSVGGEPDVMGIGPVPAVEKLFSRTGLGFSDLDLVELSEAFAVQVLAVLAGWGWNDPDKLNLLETMCVGQGVAAIFEAA